jgi:hypothetical protein
MTGQRDHDVHVPVVRDGIMAPQELAAALKLASRSGPARRGAPVGVAQVPLAIWDPG